MQRARGKRFELGLVEARRAVREMRQIDESREFVERGDRPHGLGRADEHGERSDRERLEPGLAQRAIDSAPVRFESPSPLASIRRLWWPKRGAAPPSASKIWICTAVLVT